MRHGWQIIPCLRIALALNNSTYAAGVFMGGLEGECPPNISYCSASASGEAARRGGTGSISGRLRHPKPLHREKKYWRGEASPSPSKPSPRQRCYLGL